MDLLQNNISQWLNKMGFKRNPFSEIDAAVEDYLEEYFVFPSGFEDMRAMNSSVLYAKQGDGKTACCRMLEQLCKFDDYEGCKIFSVKYDDFQKCVEKTDGNLKAVTARMHVETILRNALPDLYKIIVANPKYILKNIDLLPYLLQFLKQYSNFTISYHLNEAIKDTGIKLNTLKSVTLSKSLEGFLDKIESDYHPNIRLVVAMLEYLEIDVSLNELTPSKLMEIFFDIIDACEFDALFILIDNVDGLRETYANPEACVSLLSDIVSSTPLMSIPKVFFKFFLPIEIKSLLDNFRAFNIEHVRPITIEWSGDGMQKILKNRLITTKYRSHPIQSLDEISEVQLRGQIDQKIVKNSKTPRDLVKLGKKILTETNKCGSDLITEQILEQVLLKKETNFENLGENKKAIFISYANEDEKMAMRLYEDLIKQGFSPWITKKNLDVGLDIEYGISAAIKDSKYFLALSSSNSVSKKGFAQKEIKKALKILDLIPSSEIFIIPVRIDECEVKNEKLQSIHSADLFPCYEDGFNKILKTLKKEQ
ncbi:TIR domain-containing protein [Desulfonema limicola]|uniref:TIR domain-containing protein n=1 Tax=Desulfonema limicola TaxID=45656 RepID=A0A975BDQ0_9BACT|nr:toll/interleukin-1 receptor domain-containing protein [Desulfonema limicola]QTA83764.1 TIR domain-containing protein [Desulfonema limicola]